MVSWNIAIGLLIIAFVLPFIFLHAQLQASRARSLNDSAEMNLLRRHRKELEQHVAQDKTLFLSALGVPFILLRPSGRLIMANEEAGSLLGISTKLSINLLRSMPVCPLRDAIADAAKCGLPASKRVAHSLNGEERIYRLLVTPLDNSERHIGIVCHDITEEQRTMVIRRDFVANASHELRTPMTIIRGYLENLLESPASAEDPAMRTHALQLMQKHSERIERLIEDMLTISRLERSEIIHMNMCEFDLSGVINDVCMQLESMMNKQQAIIEMAIQPSPCSLYGDRFYWEQIIFNLVENSLKNNTNQHITIRIEAKQLGEHKLQISVIDNGCGISTESLPFIFNRFFRANISGKIKGTGLGLSIVRHAVEAQGGQITAQSEPNERTAFIITSPLHASIHQEANKLA